jgi:N6-adenosine-specific RNA methylase IME4/ParB-like chromosome segregation protein Spo0J
LSQYQLLPDLTDEEFASLKADIAARGIMVPIEMDDTGAVLDGHHRLRACEELGITDYPRVIRRGMTEDEKRAHVLALNLDRRHLSQEQKRDLVADLLRLKPDASNRQVADQVKVDHHTVSAVRETLEATGEIPQLTKTVGADGKQRPAKRPTVAPTPKLILATSDRETEKVQAVVAAAEAEPEKYAPVAERMDRTGNIDGAYRTLQAKQDEAALLATPAPTGKYRTIVVDPPWDHEGFSLAGRGAPQYAVMSHEELLALPVGEWADDDCHLYLWTTNNFIGRALDLMAAWGFAYKTVLTWVKPRIGLGSYFRSSTEHVLFGARGDLMTRARDIPTHFEAPTGEHSEKPSEFFDLVMRASYPPYLDAFARKQREGWEVWGNVGSDCDD